MKRAVNYQNIIIIVSAILIWRHQGFLYLLLFLGLAIVAAIIFGLVMTAAYAKIHKTLKETFYDFIHASFKLPSAEEGRNLDALKLEWTPQPDNKISKMELKFPNSELSVSEVDYIWRDAKQAVVEFFELDEDEVVAVFSRINEGIIEVNVLTSDKPKDLKAFAELKYLEEMHRFVYMLLFLLNNNLVAIEISGVEETDSGYRFGTFSITCDEPFSDKTLDEIKSGFAFKYPNDNLVWSLSQEGRRLEAKQVPAV